LNKKLYWQTLDFKLRITKILEPKHTAQRYAWVIWNLAKWNSVKWNETRRIGAIFACFRVARVCQHQLGFLVFRAVIDAKLTYTSSAQLPTDSDWKQLSAEVIDLDFAVKNKYFSCFQIFSQNLLNVEQAGGLCHHILCNNNRMLNTFLPNKTDDIYHLSQRPHNRSLTVRADMGSKRIPGRHFSMNLVSYW